MIATSAVATSNSANSITSRTNTASTNTASSSADAVSNSHASALRTQKSGEPGGLLRAHHFMHHADA